MPSFPTLIVKDVQASSDFYQNALGFKHIFSMPGPDGQPSLVHLRWVKYADLLIARSRDGQERNEPKGMGISLSYNMFEHFNGEMEAFAKHARGNGANVVGPVDQPWNVREVTLMDPDGYKLMFIVPISLNLKFEEVIGRVQKEERKNGL